MLFIVSPPSVRGLQSLCVIALFATHVPARPTPSPQILNIYDAFPEAADAKSADYEFVGRLPDFGKEASYITPWNTGISPRGMVVNSQCP